MKAEGWSAERQKARAGFVPNSSEVERACASCPFRVGNATAWRRLVARLKRAGWEKLSGLTSPPKVTPEKMRATIHRSVGEVAPQFNCHGVIYTPEMGMRPPREWRQCAGATRYYKTGTLVPRGQPR